MSGEDTGLLPVQLTSPCIRQLCSSCGHFQDAAKEEFKFRFREILFAVCSHFLVSACELSRYMHGLQECCFHPQCRLVQHQDTTRRSRETSKHNTNRGASTKKKKQLSFFLLYRKPQKVVIMWRLDQRICSQKNTRKVREVSDF